MGKYDQLTEKELQKLWKAKPGPNARILKPLAAKQTDSAAKFIYDCIFKQAFGKDAKSVSKQLLSMGAVAAPYVAELISKTDNIQYGDTLVQDWLAALGAWGEAGKQAAKDKQTVFIEQSNELFDELEQQLEKLPEGLRAAVEDRIFLGHGAKASEETEAQLDQQAELLEAWVGYLNPEIRTWSDAWRARRQEFARLHRAIRELDTVVRSGVQLWKKGAEGRNIYCRPQLPA